ncbi:MAG: hypothetical protein R3B93_11315 [Bacteroidia bacterium]
MQLQKRLASACKDHGITYIRGDECEDPDIIRLIWEEIAQASHVLIDLTGLSTNVALELGIAHALGRPYLMVGQRTNIPERSVVQTVFPMISKLRFDLYDHPGELPEILQKFFN